jgi:cyclohexanone monooxygenase
LEETGFIPKKKYTDAAETLEYCHLICEKYELYDNACLQTEVISTVWDEDIKRWIVKTNKNDKIKARFVVHSNGPLNRPKLPAIKGINDFKGHTFHTSRWDYDYTGGDSNGNLSNLKGKRVAVIGTGATAVQCVPHLGEAAKELIVFQRTPSSIDVRNNQHTDTEWLLNQKPGWHQNRRNNFETLLTGGIVKKDLVSDGWTEAFRLLFGNLRDKAPSRIKISLWALMSVFSIDMYKSGFRKFMTKKVSDYMDLANAIQIADYQKMEMVRTRAEEIVNDKETAESLKPYYNQFCKRPCFHDEYLKTYNRENVRLIDTDGKGLEELSEKGIIFNDVEYEVDCIIFATGFEVGTDYSRRSGYQIKGVNNLTISEKWKKGLSTFHGMHSRGFPNCFFFGHAQSGFTASYTYSLDEQSIHMAYIIKETNKRGATRVETSKEAEDSWINTIIEKARITATFQENCTPGYYNNEGKINQTPQNNTYGGGPIEFFSLLKKWRSKGNLRGLEITNN